MSKNKYIKTLLLNGFDKIDECTVIGLDEDHLVNIIDENGDYYRLTHMQRKNLY